MHFLWLKGLTAVEISREVGDVYGQAVLSLRTVEGWLARFAAGDETLEDLPGVGDRVQTQILLSSPNYSPTIPIFRRK
jgi:hypothetical protein